MRRGEDQQEMKYPCCLMAAPGCSHHTIRTFGTEYSGLQSWSRFDSHTNPITSLKQVNKWRAECTNLGTCRLTGLQPWKTTIKLYCFLLMSKSLFCLFPKDYISLWLPSPRQLAGFPKTAFRIKLSLCFSSVKCIKGFLPPGTLWWSIWNFLGVFWITKT